jgi:hypothetical protein
MKPKIKDIRTLRDCLYNCSTDNTATKEQHTYARGLFVGVVATVMAMTNCDYETAIETIKPYLHDTFDYSVLPFSWQNDFVGDK